MSIITKTKRTKDVTENGQLDSGLRPVLPKRPSVSNSNQEINVSPTMALPPNTGGKEPGKNKDSNKKMVHNAVEHKRKARINTYIANLAKLLPNKDGRRWSKIEALQKAVDYINEVKEAHEKLLLGKIDEVKEVEFGRLKRRIEELERQNANYEKLLGFAGIAPTADPSAIWKQRNSFIGKLDPELVGMSDDGDVVLLSEEKRSPKDVETTKKTMDEMEPKKRKAKRAKVYVQTMQQNGTLEVSAPLTQVVTTGWVTGMFATAANESAVTQSTNCATAVTQTLPGVPIMSTSHSLTTLQQQQQPPQVTTFQQQQPPQATTFQQQQQQQATTVVNQLPLLNFGATVNVMQTPMITINEQGIPVLQMVQQQSHNGQMIVNGNLIAGDATTIDCQAAQTQSLIQTDAGIFHQTIVGHPATRYVSHGTSQAPQMRLLTPQMISTQNGNVLLGSQPSNTVLTMNSTASNNNTLPSALMLPNGQIIPVVREPSLIYPNTNPLTENLLMTATTNVPQTIISASNRIQAQAGVANPIVPTISSVGLDNVRLSTTQVSDERRTPQALISNILPSNVQQVNPPRSLSVPCSTSDLSCSTKHQETGVSSSIPSRSSTPVTSQGTKKASSRRTQRAIKPKPQPSASPVQSTTNANMPTSKDKSTKKKARSSSPLVVVRTLASTPTLKSVQTTTTTTAANTKSTEVPHKSVVNSPRPSVVSRPSSLMNDILAQATESIFATSASDLVSPTSSNYYPGNGGGNDIDYMQPTVTETVVSSSRSLVSSESAQTTQAEPAPTPNVKDSSSEGGQEDGPSNLPTNDSQQKNVDILSDLVGEVYQTATCDSPVVTTLATTDSPSCALGIVTSTCAIEDITASPTSVVTSSGMDNFNSANMELATTFRESNLAESTPPRNGMELNLSATPNHPSPGQPAMSRSSKRECTYEEPTPKRHRDEDVGADSLMDKEDSCKVGDASVSQQSPPSDESPASVSNASSIVVNFVSVSQLASSSSSVVTSVVPPASSCSVTFTNTIATSIAPFSIETAISNDSSPLCSISPLLSSPNNKSNDLTFSLGAAISDLSRSDEATSGLGMEACAGGATFSPSFTPNSLTGSPNFGLPELGGGLNGQHPNFRTTPYQMSEPTRQSFGGVSDSQAIAPHTCVDKGQPKTHTMVYGQQQHQMGHHHHQQHHRGPMTSGHNFHTMQTSTTQVPPLFCQGYSTPLTHHTGQLDTTQSRPSLPNSGTNITEPQSDVSSSKSKSSTNHGRSSVDNSESSGIVASPPTVQVQRSQSVHHIPDTCRTQMPGLNHHRHTPSYPTSASRLHPLNHQSAQGNIPSNTNSNNAHSPKVGDVNGHSPMGGGGGGPHSVASSSSTSPKPGMPSRNHPVASPGRSVLPTPPISSPTTFVAHSTVDAQMIGGYTAAAAAAPDGMVTSPNTFRDLNFPVGQKHSSHQATTMNATASRTIISYSAESLFQIQPRHRPNCAREGHAVSPMGRQLLVGTDPLQGPSGGPQPPFLQNVSRLSASESIQNSTFPYFTLQQPTTNDQVRPQLGMPIPPTSAGAPLKHNLPTQISNVNKSCPPAAPPTRTSSEAGSMLSAQSLPNFTFSLMQHAPSEAQLTPQQHQRAGGGSHSGASHDMNPMRHNNYLPMGSYAAQMSAQIPGLQCPSQKDIQQFHHHSMPPFGSNQPPAAGNHNVRGQVLTNTFGPHSCGAMENGTSFADSTTYQGQPTSNSSNIPNVQVQAKSTHYKSKKNQDGATAKPSKSKQQTSRKKQHQQQQQLQYGMEEVNLSNSIFETGRSMTPYFSISNLSPPRNEAPTYIPSTNPLFNASQRGVAPNVAVQQSKASDVASGPPYNPLFTPRSQGGPGTLNLNFQTPPGFGVNHLHHGNGGSVPNQIAGPSGVPPPPHVPNFNLSNIFPDINGSNDGLSMSPIKFHHPGNHILPPTHHQPPSGMEHNLQHHQAGPLYHNRAHPPPPPPPPIHNGMTINSLLGHNPHGFDSRPQVAIGINNTMTPPFHGHSHATSFGNVIPALNFSMHDH